jgi:hypothetical protein
MFLCRPSCCHTELFFRPEPFFVAPSVSEGSLGTCVPRDDFPKRRSERSEEGRRPERSDGCLAIARQDNKKDARQDKVGGPF